MNECKTTKPRSDKWEDRINTSTKYALYFIAWISVSIVYFLLNPIIEIREVTKGYECIEEIVCRPDIVKEYVYGGCESNQWK